MLKKEPLRDEGLASLQSYTLRLNAHVDTQTYAGTYKHAHFVRDLTQLEQKYGYNGGRSETVRNMTQMGRKLGGCMLARLSQPSLFVHFSFAMQRNYSH